MSIDKHFKSEQDNFEFTNFVDKLFDKMITPVGWLVVVVALVSLYEVISRYVFSAPTIWAFEVSYTLIAILFVLSGVKALARDSHVKIDLLEHFLPNRGKIILRFVNRIILTVVTYALTYIAAISAWQSINVRANEFLSLEHTGTILNSPAPAIIKCTLFVSCAIMTIQATVQLVVRFKNLVNELKGNEQ